MRRYVVFWLAGETDLQLVCDGDGVRVAAEVPRGSVRRLHDVLAGAPRVVVEDEVVLPRASRGAHVDLPPSGQAPFVHPRRLLPVLLAIEDEVSRKPARVEAVVIVNTKRDPDLGPAQDECFAVGPILSMWLRDRLGLSCRSMPWRPEDDHDPLPAVPFVVWFDALRGREEERGEGPRDRPLRLEAVRRIDAAVRRVMGAAGARCGRDDELIPCVSRVGGIRSVNQHVRESLALHARGLALHDLDADPGRAGRYLALPFPVEERPGPLDSLRVRSAVLGRLRAADILSADALASQLDDVPEEDAWRGPIHSAARWLLGDGPRPSAFGRLPRFGAFDYAARAELAWAAGWRAETLLWISALIEGAVFGLVAGMPDVHAVSPKDGTLRWAGPPESLVSEAALVPAGDGRWRFRVSPKLCEIWFDVFGEAGLDIGCLRGFHRALDARVGTSLGPMCVRDLRNAVTHRTLGEEVTNCIEGVLTGAGILDPSRAVGQRILAAGPIPAVLALGGVRNAPSRLRRLFDDLEGRLLRHQPA